MVVDVVFVVIGLVGLHVSNEERITRAIIRELGGDTLRGFSRAIHAFSDADGAMNKAKALFKLFGQIFNAGGFQGHPQDHQGRNELVGIGLRRA